MSLATAASWAPTKKGRSKRIEFRVGIHQGDVIIEGGDIFGDGVNVAARLEGFAEPGGICVSGRVQEDAEGKLEITFETAGEQQLKNIARPIRLYRVRLSGAAPSSRPALPLPDKPSIAVLPFQNMSGDPEQDYFADGIVEEIITALSRSKQLFVIARNSTFTYKGRAVDVKQVGRELGVRYVVEGSVRKVGSRVRITAQFIDATTAAHIWAERYDRELTDLFVVQDDITSAVASAVGPALAHAERQRVIRKPPDSLDAWEAYHRGMWHWVQLKVEENTAAKAFFQRAIDLDPNFGGGYCGLASCYLFEGWLYFTLSFPECVRLARPLAQRAIALDDADAMAHLALAWAFCMSGDTTGWRAEAERAVELDPNNAWVMSILACYYVWHGTATDALGLLDKTMRASPHDPMMGWWMSWVIIIKYRARDYEGALKASDRLIRFRPEMPMPYRWRAAALAQLGELDEASKALQQAIAISPTSFYGNVRQRHAYMSPETYLHMLEGLRKAGLPE
jgi:adenylate cyclase